MYLRLKPYEKVAHLPMVVGRPFNTGDQQLSPGTPEPMGLLPRTRKLLYQQRSLVLGSSEASTAPETGVTPSTQPAKPPISANGKTTPKAKPFKS